LPRINPLFRLLRRVSLKLLNLQAFFSKTATEAAPFAKSAVFAPVTSGFRPSPVRFLTLAEDDKR
jgi:hypothetical protein